MKTTKLFLYSTAIGSLFLSTASAALKTGEPAPDFTLACASGETVALADFQGQLVVLEWLNHGCPFVVRHYKDGNMQGLQGRVTGEGGVWLSIVSSAPGEQGYSSAVEALKKKETIGSRATHVLLDPKGEVGRAYVARTTPQIFIINEEGVLVYQGAIDDRPRGPIDGAVNYVTASLDALASGQPIEVNTTRPYGCSVKYK
ncbi:MAG: redoxin domain-containing protein [Puniceicoccaceae bacterium]